MQASVIAVVLAGGKSARMGQDKAALYSPALQTTLLDQSLNCLAQLADCEVVISSNTHPEGIKDVIAQRGPLSGMHAVTKRYQAAPPASGYLFIPVDMPNLRPATLSALLQFAQQNQCAAYFNTSFLPCFLPAEPKLSNIIEQQLQHQDWSIRALLTRCGARSMLWHEQTQLININHPQDWQRYCG